MGRSYTTTEVSVLTIIIARYEKATADLKRSIDLKRSANDSKPQFDIDHEFMLALLGVTSYSPPFRFDDASKGQDASLQDIPIPSEGSQSADLSKPSTKKPSTQPYLDYLEQSHHRYIIEAKNENSSLQTSPQSLIAKHLTQDLPREFKLDENNGPMNPITESSIRNPANIEIKTTLRWATNVTDAVAKIDAYMLKSLNHYNLGFMTISKGYPDGPINQLLFYFRRILVQLGQGFTPQRMYQAYLLDKFIERLSTTKLKVNWFDGGQYIADLLIEIKEKYLNAIILDFEKEEANESVPSLFKELSDALSSTLQYAYGIYLNMLVLPNTDGKNVYLSHTDVLKSLENEFEQLQRSIALRMNEEQRHLQDNVELQQEIKQKYLLDFKKKLQEKYQGTKSKQQIEQLIAEEKHRVETHRDVMNGIIKEHLNRIEQEIKHQHEEKLSDQIRVDHTDYWIQSRALAITLFQQESAIGKYVNSGLKVLYNASKGKAKIDSSSSRNETSSGSLQQLMETSNIDSDVKLQHQMILHMRGSESRALRQWKLQKLNSGVHPVIQTYEQMSYIRDMTLITQNIILGDILELYASVNYSIEQVKNAASKTGELLFLYLEEEMQKALAQARVLNKSLVERMRKIKSILTNFVNILRKEGNVPQAYLDHVDILADRILTVDHNIRTMTIFINKLENYTLTWKEHSEERLLRVNESINRAALSINYVDQILRHILDGNYSSANAFQPKQLGPDKLNKFLPTARVLGLTKERELEELPPSIEEEDPLEESSFRLPQQQNALDYPSMPLGYYQRQMHADSLHQQRIAMANEQELAAFRALGRQQASQIADEINRLEAEKNKLHGQASSSANPNPNKAQLTFLDKQIESLTLEQSKIFSELGINFQEIEESKTNQEEMAQRKKSILGTKGN